jgi:hypothetical protein
MEDLPFLSLYISNALVWVLHSCLWAVVAEMHSLFYVLFHPLNTLNLWLEDDPNASIVDVLYLFTTFSAFGIWLVFDRYQKAVNSAVPFRHPAPEVCLFCILPTEEPS